MQTITGNTDIIAVQIGQIVFDNDKLNVYLFHSTIKIRWTPVGWNKNKQKYIDAGAPTEYITDAESLIDGVPKYQAVGVFFPQYFTMISDGDEYTTLTQVANLTTITGLETADNNIVSDLKDTEMTPAQLPIRPHFYYGTYSIFGSYTKSGMCYKKGLECAHKYYNDKIKTRFNLNAFPLICEEHDYDINKFEQN